MLQTTHAEVRPGVVLISFKGNLMRGPEGEEIEPLVSGYLARGLRRFIIDITDLKRIDSTGIGRFISCLNAIQEAGGELHMLASAGYVRDTFRITRLDTVFRFYTTLETAVAAW